MPTPREQLLQLLATNSFRLGEFKLSSGGTSDYYVDCRTTTLHAEGARLSGRVVYDEIQKQRWSPQAIGGMTMGADPAHVFNHINNFLCEHSEVGRYATMFFGVLSRNGDLQYINAGHPSPLLFRRGELAEPFTEGSYPVGLVPGAEYKAACVKLEADDTLILFSDGVTEAVDPEEQLFGVPRLREALAGRHDAPLEQLQKAVFDSVEKFSRGASQVDDITLLLVRYRTARTAAS